MAQICIAACQRYTSRQCRKLSPRLTVIPSEVPVSWLVADNACLFMPKRSKYKKKWAVMNQRAEQSRDVAMRCFELELKPVFGEKVWRSIRLALQSPPKYAAVLNDFSAACSDTENDLRGRSAIDIFNFSLSNQTKTITGKEPGAPTDLSVSLPVTEIPAREDATNFGGENVPEDDAYEYVTATRLVGRDYEMEQTSVLTSDTEDEFGNQLSSGLGIPQVVDDDLPVLNHMWPLRAYVFPWGSVKTFGQPQFDGARLSNFYPMDAASLLPVLALNVQAGDEVLDACAAPGGKSFAILQQRRAASLCMNDLSLARMQRLKRMLISYFPSPPVIDSATAMNQLASARDTYSTVTEVGQTKLQYATENICEHKWDKEFDRILVDVQCTTDRNSAIDNENNWHSTRRTSERHQLPEKQKRMLSNALRALRVGGICVYSTCSMSPVQNDGVVYSALREAQRLFKIECEVLDVKPWMEPLNGLFRLYAIGGSERPFGVTAFPHICSNFGPIYVCKLRRKR